MEELKIYKDRDLREALRRREARRSKSQPSADFCNNVMQRITSRADKQSPYKSTVIGVAAAIALLFSVGVVLNNQDGEKPDLVAKTDTIKVKEQPQKKEESKETADTVKRVKEMIRMSLPPRHYMAKQKTKAEPAPATDLTDVNNQEEQAIAAEEQRLEMEMMAAMNRSLQTDFQEMTREIRQRGERMTQQVEIALSDE